MKNNPTPDKAKLEAKIGRVKSHIERHSRDAASQMHLVKMKEKLLRSAYRAKNEPTV